jgi:YhcG PDDEXK nuclease domain
MTTDLHLDCLGAFGLKAERFEPKYVGKLTFYLEAVDSDLRNSQDQPAIGVLPCASNEAEVVDYALSRILSSTLIAEYQTQLPNKKLLRVMLHDFYLQNTPEGDEQ